MGDGIVLNEVLDQRRHYTFREKFSTECQRVYDYAVEKYEERKVEVQQMRDCVNAAVHASREQGTKRVNDFIAYKAQVSGFVALQARCIHSGIQRETAGQLSLPSFREVPASAGKAKTWIILFADRRMAV